MFTCREICFAILFIVMGSVSASVCPENRNKICTCEPNMLHQIVIFCQINDSSIKIVYASSEFMMVTCNNAKWSDFQLHNLTKRAISSTYFYMCDLPNNSSLKTITDMLGAVMVQKLVFQSHKNLISFKRLHLKGFEDLHSLDISNNNISIVDIDLLANLPNLKRLGMRKSNIHTATILFDHVPNLQELDLGENTLEMIEPGTFDRFHNLKYLSLTNNKIIELESGTFDKLVNLRTLHFKSNNLVSLPEDIFGKLENLETLDLSDNNFTSLPSDLLENNTNLRVIDLAYNNRKLNNLPSGFFSNLTKLELLMLERNGLDSLPKDLLWGCISLDSLFLSKNNLAFLHNLIFQDLSELTELKLDSNAFEKIPNVFWNLVQLRKLDLSKNRIFSIDEEIFKNLHKLVELNMAENFLTVIADGSLSSLRYLEIANFSHNNLTLHTAPKNDFDEDRVSSPFDSCDFLEELYLSNNRISEIFTDWVSDLEYLQKLDLKHNYIRSLYTEDLHFASEDIEVDLTYNKIQYIFLNNAEDFFSHDWSNRVLILIQHNPLHCGCELYDYLRYIENRMLSSIRKYFNIDPKNVTCFTPLKLQNVSVTNLQSKSFKCAAMNTNDESMCPDKCNCYKKLEEQTFIIDCFRKNLTVVPSVKNIPHKFWQITLNLSDNHLTQMPNLAKLGYGPVSILTLSHNNISEISLDGLPKSIEVLELHNNKISKLSSEVINFLENAANLYLITLHDNPFICNCSTTNFFDFTHTEKHRIADLHMIECQEKNELISKMTMTDFCSNKAGWFGRYYIWIMFVVVLLFISIVSFFYCKDQEQLRKKFAFRSLLEGNDEDGEMTDVTEEKCYDVFISYSQDDHDFVMNELVHKLENGVSPLKLYLPHGDWLVDEWTTTNIMESIEMSRRMMVVLSPSFLENVWGKTELRTAHCQALSKDQSNVILILYGDIEPTDEHLDSELKAYINANTYIKWGDPWFWKKLGQSLTHNFEDEANASGYNEPAIRYYNQGSNKQLFSS